VYELFRRYALFSQCSAQDRERELLAVLRGDRVYGDTAAFEGLIENIRTQVRLRLSEPVFQPLLPENSEPRERTPMSAGDAAYRGLLAIAQKYCHKLALPLSGEFIGQFVRRIDQVLQITFGNLVESLRARRQFAREFEVEATRILNWAPNQIKMAENEQQVGAYLLDAVSSAKPSEAAMADLERVFRDLALHQIGLVKGFEESLRAVLREFDPAAIEADIRVSPLRIGPLRLPATFRLFKRRTAWRHFKLKHRRFSEDEVRIFEQILAPHFAKGYLDVQKTQRSP
jgi:predicted component of type VI protein secretion system